MVTSQHVAAAPPFNFNFNINVLSFLCTRDFSLCINDSHISQQVLYVKKRLMVFCSFFFLESHGFLKFVWLLVDFSLAAFECGEGVC